MEFDAFDAGVEWGGLRSRGEIKLILCYLAVSLRQPLGKELLNQAMTESGLANYFEVNQAISELLQSGNFAEVEPDIYQVTESGTMAANTLESSLPVTVREKAVKSCLKLMARVQAERENRVSIERTGRGCSITCAINDGTDDLMSFKLFVADSMQAQVVKDLFLKDPAGFYERLVQKLFDPGAESSGEE